MSGKIEKSKPRPAARPPASAKKPAVPSKGWSSPQVGRPPAKSGPAPGVRVQQQGGGIQRKGPAVTGSTAGAGQETRVTLQNRLGDLQGALLLTDIQGDLGEIETGLSLLPVELEKLRTRGYVFRSFLENKIQVLSGQWGDVHNRVSYEVSNRQRELERDASEAENLLRLASAGQTARAESALSALEHKVSAARSAVGAMYTSLRDNVNQTRAQVEQIAWLLDQIDEASFQIRPAEDPIMACRAQLLEKGDKEGPEGVLFLTDARLFFERKEEVATKKVLFVTTEKEKVQELVFEVPIGQVEEVKSSQKGFLGHKEMLELQFAREADMSGAKLRLQGADNEEWAALIGRVKSGEIDKERTQPKDEAVVEAARSVPTKCPTCGATLSVEIVRGMREINCEYCGSVIRL